MKTSTSFLFVGLCFWLAAACNRSASDVTPSALDSVGVVGTFVSAEALTFNGKPASIVALAVDSAGNIYAADRGNAIIRKISPTGEVKTLAGSGKRGYQDGPAATAQFDAMTSLAIDKAGNLYVGEALNNSCIRKITPAGQVSTFAGKPFELENISSYLKASPDGPDTSARFVAVIALAFDSSDNLYVADGSSVAYYASDAIRKVTPNGYVRTIAGGISGLPFQGRIVGNSLYPRYFLSLAVNRADKLAGLDQGNQSIFQITPTGDVSQLFPRGTFYPSSGMLYDQSGNLLVARYTKIQQISPDGQVTILTGTNERKFVNDSLRLARFESISALAVDKKNLLYIADQGSQSIRRVRLK